jgi:hypothetical protein
MLNNQRVIPSMFLELIAFTNRPCDNILIYNERQQHAWTTGTLETITGNVSSARMISKNEQFTGLLPIPHIPPGYIWVDKEETCGKIM